MDVHAIRTELLEGSSPELARRRALVALAALGVVDFAALSLLQTGVVRSLPDPPGRLFDSTAVSSSETAYEMGVPDATTGALLYALELVLASAGGSRRTGRPAVLDLLLAGAVAAGVGGAARYLWDMVVHQKRACAYCLVGAAVNVAMVPLVAPEAVASARAWLARRAMPSRRRVLLG